MALIPTSEIMQQAYMHYHKNVIKFLMIVELCQLCNIFLEGKILKLLLFN